MELRCFGCSKPYVRHYTLWYGEGEVAVCPDCFSLWERMRNLSHLTALPAAAPAHEKEG